MTTCYINGNYRDILESKVSITDRGFQFSDGIYEVIAVYENRLKIIQGFKPERQLELRDRIMDEINGYRRILLFVNLYDDDAQRDSLENKIYNSIKDLVIFDEMMEEN